MGFSGRTLRWLALVLATVAAVTAGVFAWARLRPLPTEPLRIGYAYDPPYHFGGDDGGVHGMAVDIVNEAARRIGLRLEWRYDPRNSWMLVRDGVVDLWPLLADLPEREGFVHVSEPYLASDFYFLLLDGVPVPEHGYAGEVGVFHLPIMQRFLQHVLPRARRRPYETTELVAEAVCRGEVPVGLLNIGAVTAVLRLPPAGCVKPLRTVKIPGVSVALGVGASLRYGWVADRLRREVAVMAADGTLGRLLMPYAVTSTMEVLTAIEVDEAQRRARTFERGMVLSGLALLVVVTLGVALLRSNRRAFAALGAQRELESRLREREYMEVVGRLAGGIAHDFNNTMTVINGHCELMLEDMPPADERRFPLEEIQKAGVRASSLVQQLLAFGRKQVVRPARVSAHAVLTGFVPTLHRLLGEDVELEVSKADGLDEIVVDPGQLQQIALNLSVNARDAMPHGGRLRFETGPVSLQRAEAEAAGLEPGRFVRIRVHDTGTGMDEETRRHAFEPFFTTKPFGAGSGLGLATVYGAIKQAGGGASIASAPGHGTTFDLFFPIA